MRPYDKLWKRAAVTGVCVFAGNALMAFLVAAFIIPHDIVMGGTTGIGLVLHRLLPQLDVSLFILILNILLVILGLIVLGRKFALTTVASSLMYPVLLVLMQRLPGIGSLTDSPLVAAVFAGSLMGVALGLVMRVGSSTGGTDIVNLVLSRVTHRPVSVFVYITDLVIVALQVLTATSEQILLGVIVIVLETLVLDKAMLLGKSRVQIFAVTEQYEEVRALLLDRADVGVTMLHIETGRLAREGKGVLCIIPQRKLFEATELIRAADPHAFITVTQIREVRGRGFTEERARIPGGGERQKNETGGAI